MKKLILPLIAIAFIMAPTSQAASLENTDWECHEMAEAGAEAAEGDDAAKYRVYDAVYQECIN